MRYLARPRGAVGRGVGSEHAIRRMLDTFPIVRRQCDVITPGVREQVRVRGVVRRGGSDASTDPHAQPVCTQPARSCKPFSSLLPVASVKPCCRMQSKWGEKKKRSHFRHGV